LRFLDAIETTVDLLCQYPEAGGAVPTTRPEAKGLRAKLVNGFGNYVVLYFVTAETVDIARVIRGGQEIDQIALKCT
jgi:plasmid stabilization system protein ParE